MDITQKAILVNLSVHGWKGRKLDKRASSETAARYSAEERATRVTKQLVAKDALERLQNAEVRLRWIHHQYTLPWLDTGDRLLPTDRYQKYMDEIRYAKAEYEEAAEEFLSHYDDYRDAARVSLGALFDEDDYPPQEQIAKRFRVDLHVRPIPDERDIRVSLSKEEIDEIVENVRRGALQGVEGAVREAWERVRDTCQKYYNVASSKANVVLGRFNDAFLSSAEIVGSLVTSVGKIAHDDDLTVVGETLRRLHNGRTRKDYIKQEALRDDLATQSFRLLEQAHRALGLPPPDRKADETALPDGKRRSPKTPEEVMNKLHGVF